MVQIKDIPFIVGKYIDTEIAPKAGDVDKFKIYFVYGLFRDRYLGIIEPYMSMLSSGGIVNEDNSMFDLESLHESAKFAMDKTGKLNVKGYLMDKQDVEALYQIAKGYDK